MARATSFAAWHGHVGHDEWRWVKPQLLGLSLRPDATTQGALEIEPINVTRVVGREPYRVAAETERIATGSRPLAL